MSFADEYERLYGNGKSRKKRGKTHKTGLMYFKFIVMMLACIAALVYVCYKIIWYKNTKGAEYEQRTIMQLINKDATSDVPIRPNRGAIMDRNKQTLAFSTIVYTVFADIRLLDYRINDGKEAVVEETFKKASEILDIPEEDLWALLAKDSDGKLIFDTNYKIIATQVPQSVASALKSAKLYDIYTEEDSKRSYVDGTLAAQVIGFTRGDSAWGIESRYNKELTGTYGREFRTYDSNGRSVVSERVEAQEGYTLITTLDLYIQQCAERNVTKYGREYGAQYAAYIVMNPNTGEILAMASYPSFNLSDPLNPAYITNPDMAESYAQLNQQSLVDNFNRMWNNFNVTSTFEPGSIYKPITVAAALEEGIIITDDTFACNGGNTVNGVFIKCNSTHNTVTVRQSLARSCNVAMMKIAEKMGREIFYNYLQDFGFGERTGIDLPAEVSGLLHTYSQFQNVELATASFGQRFTVTPIQAITAFSALINGGYLYKPYIVSQVIGANNTVVSERKPEAVRQVISKETSDFLRDALVDTLVYGTGARAKIEGHNVGGKSGTAEQGIKGSEDYHEAASFVGYFPADDPQYVVLALIYNPTGATPSASYMFRELVLDIIGYKHIKPVNDVNGQQASNMVMSDYTDKPLWIALQELNRLSLEYELIGNGDTVEGQFPNPGASITLMTNVFLMLTQTGDEPLAEIPDLSGMTVREARAALTAAGFIATVAFDDHGNTYDDLNFVYDQMPGAYLKITPGVEVKIWAGSR